MYTNKTAALYASLGVTGTTYQAAFEALLAKAGSLEGLAVMDFGCGSGRSARLLQTLAPSRLVGIDQNASMIEQARKLTDSSIEFVHIEKDMLEFPFPAESFDRVFSCSVYCELSSRDLMKTATASLYRLLKTGGQFYMMTTNPCCLGANFISYHYASQPGVKDGDPITCHVHTDPPFTIDDTWWSVPAMDQVFEECGFKICDRLLPTATGPGWRDEVNVAPSIIYHLEKPNL